MQIQDGGAMRFVGRPILPVGTRAGDFPVMDMTDAIRYLGALALVLALVGIAGLALRRYGLPGVALGSGRRLQLVEQLMLGKNHRLMIVRCDGVEHVLVTAPQGASLIASTSAKPAIESVPQ
jgi:flagellar protein FliO/FliZ